MQNPLEKEPQEGQSINLRELLSNTDRIGLNLLLSSIQCTVRLADASSDHGGMVPSIVLRVASTIYEVAVAVLSPTTYKVFLGFWGVEQIIAFSRFLSSGSDEGIRL